MGGGVTVPCIGDDRCNGYVTLRLVMVMVI